MRPPLLLPAASAQGMSASAAFVGLYKRLYAVPFPFSFPVSELGI